MAGLDPAIHVFGASGKQDVDARDKPGHDEERDCRKVILRRNLFGLHALHCGPYIHPSTLTDSDREI
jgi:hypothetical protein